MFEYRINVRTRYYGTLEGVPVNIIKGTQPDGQLSVQVESAIFPGGEVSREVLLAMMGECQLTAEEYELAHKIANAGRLPIDPTAGEVPRGIYEEIRLRGD